MTKDRKLKQSTLKLTGPLQVRRRLWSCGMAKLTGENHEVFMVGKAGKVCTAA